MKILMWCTWIWFLTYKQLKKHKHSQVDITQAVDNNINNDIDDKTGEVENVVKSDYNEETLEDVVDGNVIKA